MCGSRRRMLSLMSATGLLAVVRPVPAGADTTDDRARLLANTVAIFAGTPQSNTRPEVAAKLAGIDRTARTWLGRIAPSPQGLLSGVPLGTSDANLDASFQHLYEIALATATPGGASEGDDPARHQVIDGLRWLHDNYYGDQSAGYYGNWFTWEIGISAMDRTIHRRPGYAFALTQLVDRVHGSTHLRFTTFRLYGRSSSIDLS